METTFSNAQRAEVLTQALPYIKRYTGKVVVVKYGGNAMVNEQLKQQVMEDIVLLETQTARKGAQVFHLQFAVGEFDMVVFYPQTASCEVCEIKHSTEIAPEQTRHLQDEKKCAETAARFGTITGRYVIYRGETKDIDGIHYVNVEEYLRAL